MQALLSHIDILRTTQPRLFSREAQISQANIRIWPVRRRSANVDASAPSLHIMRAGTYHEKSIQVLAGCVQRAWRARERERTNSQAL